MVYERSWGWRSAAGIYVLNHSLKMVDRSAVVKAYTNSKGVFTVLSYRSPKNIPASFAFDDYATELFKTLKGRKATVLPLSDWAGRSDRKNKIDILERLRNLGQLGGHHNE